MRILHILDHSIPLHSGYTFRTAALLKGQQNLGWETYHITSPKQGVTQLPEEDVDGLHFYRTPVPDSTAKKRPIAGELALMRALEKRLYEVASELKPDILHAHSPVLNVLPALRVGAKLGIPVVYEIRAFWEDAAVDHGTTTEGSFRYRSIRALETFALKRVAHAFTICEGLRADIVKRGVPAEKVTVIPNAVDINAFQLAGLPSPDLQEKYGLAGKTVIGFIGSYYAYEGLDLLLDALPGILQVRADIHILLVGGGPQESNLKKQAEALGIAANVSFVGRVPHSEVNRYYDLIDILAYPRHPMRLTELVTPLKPLEAMAQGQIFVASDVGGHKELIRHQETGILFKAGDSAALAAAILNLLEKKETWQSMRDAGRRYVESERNWKNSVANYNSPYKKLLEK